MPNSEQSQFLEACRTALIDGSFKRVVLSRKDGERGALAALDYLSTLPILNDPEAVMTRLKKHLGKTKKRIISKDDLVKLKQIEEDEARAKNLEDFKFGSNEEMLEMLG